MSRELDRGIELVALEPQRRHGAVQGRVDRPLDSGAPAIASSISRSGGTCSGVRHDALHMLGGGLQGDEIGLETDLPRSSSPNVSEVQMKSSSSSASKSP